MSIPYLAIAIFPKLILLLPKSGKWTNYVKYFLAILIAATIVWVLNILYNFYNDFFVILFLFIIFILFISYRFNLYKIYISVVSVACALSLIDKNY